MARKAITRTIEEHKGYDYAYTDLSRPREYARIAKNIITTGTESVRKRWGFQVVTPNLKAAGLAPYATPRYPETAALYNTLLVIGEQGGDHGVYGTREGYLAVTYSGSGQASIEFLPDALANVFYMTLKVDGVAVTGWPKTYGTGLETSLDTLDDLAADIAAESDWAATTNPGNSQYLFSSVYVSAANLFMFKETNLTTGVATNFPYEYVDCWPNHSDYTVQNYDSDNLSPPAVFKNPTFVGLQDCIYVFLDGNKENLAHRNWKFDGIAFYPMGLPTSLVGAASSADGSAGSRFISGTVRKYKTRLVRKDYRGNLVYSNVVHEFTHTVGGSNVASIDLTIAWNLSSEYKIKSAQVTATAVVSTTVTIASGHAFKASDIVSIFDSFAGDYVERTVQSVTATTIVVDSAVSSVNGTYVSNNVYLEIYRTKEGGDIYYYLAPGRISAGSTAYSDQTQDSQLNVVWVEPETETTNTPPEDASLAVAHQNILVTAQGTRFTGDPAEQSTSNRISFSHVTGPEYFPPDTHYVDVAFSKVGEPTGLGSDTDKLYFFKADSRAVIRGDFTTLDLYVDIKEDGVGCLSPDSVVTGTRGVYFMSGSGPQRLIDGEVDILFSKRLAKPFEKQFYILESIGDVESDKLYLQNAKFFFDFRYKHVHMFIPAYSAVGSALRPNSNSLWLVYDEVRDRISEWTAPFYPLGGMAIFNNVMYFSGYPVDADNDYGQVFREITYADEYGCVDNTVAVDMQYAPTWDHLDEPSVYKKFLHARVWCTNPDRTETFYLSYSDYRDFDASTVKTGPVLKIFSSSDVEKRIKLKPGKARTWSPLFRDNTLASRSEIDGYEVEIAGPFEKEVQK